MGLIHRRRRGGSIFQKAGKAIKKTVVKTFCGQACKKTKGARACGACCEKACNNGISRGQCNKKCSAMAFLQDAEWMDETADEEAVDEADEEAVDEADEDLSLEAEGEDWEDYDLEVEGPFHRRRRGKKFGHGLKKVARGVHKVAK